jgi:hypothetical protein
VAKSNIIDRLDSWKHTRAGYGISSIIEAALAYGFVSWAIDSGSLIAYFFTLVFSIGSFNNLFKALTYRNGKH